MSKFGKVRGAPKGSHRAPSSQPIRIPMSGSLPPAALGFTTAAQIRERVEKRAAQQTKPRSAMTGHEDIDKLLVAPKNTSAPSKEQIEAVVTAACVTAEREGKLLTERQYADFVMGRKLKEGDKVRYIGPDRTEVAENGEAYIRAHGSVAIVVQVESTPGGRMITLNPVEPLAPTNEEKEPAYVELVFKELSKAHARFERID